MINLWELDSELPFRERLRGLLPLVPLMRGGSTRERVLQARQELRTDEDLSQMEPLLAFFASYFLGAEFVSETEGWRMDLIVDSPLFKEMMRQAEERAAERAALANAREYVLELLDARFGAVPPGVVERVNGISDIGSLTELLRHAATSASLDEFARALGE